MTHGTDIIDHGQPFCDKSSCYSWEWVDWDFVTVNKPVEKEFKGRLEGSCNHIAALLYALVDVTDTKIRGIGASASKTCKWKQLKECHLSPKKACEMYSEMPSLENERVNTEPVVSSVNLERFAERLRKCAPRAGWLVNFTASKEAKTPQAPASPPVLHEPQLSLADHVNVSTDSC
nr:hypothetical protein BaRGS_005941 [Batillaria attramentaria]